MKHSTQGARLVDVIRAHWSHFHRGPTYMDLLRAGISTAPHMRLKEPGALAALKPGERIERGRNSAGLVTFLITRRKP
mgnify:FL=1